MNNRCECMLSAVTNAIFAHGDEGLARQVANDAPLMTVRSMKDLAKWVEREVRTYRFQEYEEARSGAMVDEEWLVNRCSGIAVVH